MASTRPSAIKSSNGGQSALSERQLDTGWEPVDDRKFIRAIGRGLDVLRCFHPGETALGNLEIARRVGLTKSTVSRITYTLMKLGYLTSLPDIDKYQLAAPVLSLGYATLAGLAIVEKSVPIMSELANYASGAVALGSRDRLSIIYVQHAHAPSTITLRLSVGSRVPLATTAIGRAFLLALPEQERAFLVGRIKASRPTLWPSIEKGLKVADEEYREHGFCTSFGDWQRDVWGIAAPVISLDGTKLLSLNGAVPAYACDKEHLLKGIGPRLLAAAGGISRQFI